MLQLFSSNLVVDEIKAHSRWRGFASDISGVSTYKPNQPYTGQPKYTL
jgi:hypothetical protein